MRKFILFLMLLFVPAICFAVSGYPNKGKSVNVTMTTANAVYSYEFPQGTSSVSVQSRTAADFKLSPSVSTFTTDFFTVKSGTVYNTPILALAPASPNTTFFFQSTTGGQVIEILYYQ